MSGTEDHADDLQKMWQAGACDSGRDDTMIVKLARERQRSLFDLLRQQDMQAYIITLSFAPLTAMAAWKGRPSLWLLSGYLLMTATLVIGAGAIWLYARKARRTGQLDLSRRDHQIQLLDAHDVRIRFLERTKYWYAAPLFLGAGLAGYPILAHFLGRESATFVVPALLFGCWVGAWRRNAHTVADLRKRRQDLQQLLDEMN